METILETLTTSIVSYFQSRDDPDLESLVQLPADQFAYYLLNRNVPMRDADGNTLLHWAVSYNKMDIINILFSLHLGHDLTNNYGFTPLHWAIINNNHSLVQFLIKKDFSLDVPNMNGETPYMMANKQPGMIQYIACIK